MTSDTETLVERLDGIDYESKTLTYSIIKTDRPFENYKGEMRVIEAGDKQSVVEWSGTFGLDGISEQEGKNMVGYIFDLGLNGLKELHEEDEIVHNTITRLYPDELFNSQIAGYAQVVVAPPGTTVYLAGQGAIDKEGNIVGDTMDEQMDFTFENVKIALEASGAKPEHVVKIIMLMVDYDESYLPIFEREASELFGEEHLPASMLIPVPRLAFEGMLFEIQVTAVIPLE